MIEFDCPHCGYHLFHHEEFAGLDGWCRVCKGIIVVPGPDDALDFSSVSIEQRYARLEKLFRHAKTLVGEYRQLQFKLKTENTSLIEEMKIHAVAQRPVEQLTIEQLSHQLSEVASERDEFAAQRNRLTLEVERLTEELRSEARKTVQAVESDSEQDKRGLSDSDKNGETYRGAEIKELRREKDIAHESLAEAETSKRKIANTLDEVRAELSGALEEKGTLQTELRDMAASLESLKRQFDTEVADLASRYDAEEANHSKTQGHLVEARTAIEKIPVLEKELASARTSLIERDALWEDLQRQLTSLKRESEARIEIVEKARATVQAQMETLSDDMARARAESGVISEERTALQSKLLQKTVALETIEQRLDTEVAALTSQYDTEAAKHAETREHLNGVRAELETESAEKARLQSELLEKTAALETIERRLDTEVAARTSRYDAEAAMHAETQEHLNGVRAEVETESAEKARLQSELLEKTVALETVERRLDTEVAALTSQYDAEAGKHAETQKRLNGVRAKAGKISALEEGLDAIRRRLAEQIAQHDELNQRLAAKERQLTVQNALVDALKRDSGLGRRSHREQFRLEARRFYVQEMASTIEAVGAKEDAHGKSEELNDNNTRNEAVSGANVAQTEQDSRDAGADSMYLLFSEVTENIVCPHCDETLEVSECRVGTMARCDRCGRLSVVFRSEGKYGLSTL